MASLPSDRPVLVTGATGFVGRHLLPALAGAGVSIRGASRDPARAAAAAPEHEWVALDLQRPHTLAAALAGCRAAFYLVHEVGVGRDYAERERGAAVDFRAAAEAAGLDRLVYLGGVAPAGPPSVHLASRLQVGEILRGGGVPCVELRAGMIVGAGSASWQIVEQLARRLPAMVLPRWLQNRSSPVAIDDVVVALLAALDLPVGGSRWLDLPGATVVSHKELLRSVAARFGYRPPMIDVPILGPRLSSYWIDLVTTADHALARELVEGLRHDLLPRDRGIWDRLPDRRPMSLDAAIDLALADGEAPRPPGAPALSRLHALGRSWSPPPSGSLAPP